MIEPRPWALRPAVATPPPASRQPGWVKTPIDAFILARLEENRLAPARPAGRLVLLRRATFDLTGLPPTAEEIVGFLGDTRPEAFASVVDRLLASPLYGERWGRHWLDVVRYADTSGFESDLSFEGAWRYRDYVIRSFNSNKPFDRFIQEQVAGDELWPGDPEAIAGTGLYAVGPVLNESAMVSNQLEQEWLTDCADTTGAAFLGMTLGCARCHNHKYDPITQKDYYSMQAVFAGSDRPYPAKTRELRIKALNGLLAEKPLPPELENDPRCRLKTETEAGTRLFHTVAPRETRVLHRGELGKPRERVGPAAPAVLALAPGSADFSVAAPDQRRAALARWLTSPKDNPLTPRVLVNRVWSWHFGAGIVRTPNDFGKQGEPPTHPELLDWLAMDFASGGWDLKRLHRMIMLSSVYQTAGAGSGVASQVDPENRLLSRFPRRRLEAEAVWDSLHACAGTINLRQFGPPVAPPLGKEELSGLFDAGAKWPVTNDPREHTRRGLYILVRRTFLDPVIDAFDPPDMMASCPIRLETTTPSQALALLNSKVAAEQARAFAARLVNDCGRDNKKILARAWLLAFGRPISPAEARKAKAFVALRERELSRPSGGAVAISGQVAAQEALAELALAIFNANEFIYVD